MRKERHRNICLDNYNGEVKSTGEDLILIRTKKGVLEKKVFLINRLQTSHGGSIIHDTSTIHGNTTSTRTPYETLSLTNSYTTSRFDSPYLIVKGDLTFSNVVFLFRKTFIYGLY